MDNTLPPEQTQQLPLMGLVEPQVQILIAHLNDAVTKICSIKFDVPPDKLQQMLLAHAFEHGRAEAYRSLLNYDREQFARLQEQQQPQTAQMQQSLL